MKANLFFPITTLLISTLPALGSLTITNGSFEDYDNDTTPTMPEGDNKDLIDDWYEGLHDTDGTPGTNLDETAEQVLLEGGNRPNTPAGTHWGHFLERDLTFEASIYQQIGTWNTGNQTSYTIEGTLGDRSNRNFAPLLFEFYSVSSTDGTNNPGDGIQFGAAFDSEALLDSFSTGDPFTPDGDGNNSSLVRTSDFSQGFDLTLGAGVNDGDLIWLVITQQPNVGSPEHSLVDNLTIIPESSSLFLVFAGLGILLQVRRRK